MFIVSLKQNGILTNECVLCTISFNTDHPLNLEKQKKRLLEHNYSK